MTASFEKFRRAQGAWQRVILHVDMDAFFASVEQLDNPELRGKPVLVGGTGKRSVVAAASYEAREFGCHSAMPTAIACSLCPQAIIVAGRGSRYREISDQVFAIFEDFTPIIEPLSIDEAFLDVTGSIRLLGSPVALARAIRTRIKTETGLTASVGIAPNKFLAKLGSDMDKPDGLTIIEPDNILQVLDPLPVERIFGIGPSSQKKLHRLGVRTIAQLRGLDQRALKWVFGSWGVRAGQLARGIDDRAVKSDRHAKSIGHETTFRDDVADVEHVCSVLLHLTEDVARRLRATGRFARTVTCKIRYGNFETITRSQTLSSPSNTTSALWQVAQDIFGTWAQDHFRPVRLIGITASNLVSGVQTQPMLFDDVQSTRQKALDSAADAVTARFGKHAIGRARAVEDDAH